MKGFIENSAVKLTTVAAIIILTISAIGGAIAFAVHEASWRTNMSRDIAEIKSNIAVGMDERWRVRNMRSWVNELKGRNQELDVPSVESHMDFK